MTGRKGYGGGHPGQWRMQEGAQTTVPQICRPARLPRRIVEDGWWLVASRPADVEEPPRILNCPAGTMKPVLVLQGRAIWIFDRRTT